MTLDAAGDASLEEAALLARLARLENESAAEEVAEASAGSEAADVLARLALLDVGERTAADSSVGEEAALLERLARLDCGSFDDRMGDTGRDQFSGSRIGSAAKLRVVVADKLGWRIEKGGAIAELQLAKNCVADSQRIKR